MEPLVAQYQQLIERLDRWFAEVRERQPGVIPCRTGCTTCCHGPFDISHGDMRLLREGLALLDPVARDQARTRATAVLEEIRALEPRWTAPYDLRDIDEERFDEVSEQLSALPCPLLGESGGCMVYAHRPMVCRLIGLPMMTAAGELLENACPIQDDFPTYASMSPQLFDLGDLHDTELDLLDLMSDDPEYETIIAAVVVAP